MKVRIGIGLGPAAVPAVFGDAVDRVEELGVDSLWLSEMVFGSLVEPFAGMAYALSRTSRLKVGTGVAVLPGRHPVLVAKHLASLAGLAPGRVLPVFGLRPARDAERGLFKVPAGRRAAVFEESLRLIRLLLTAVSLLASATRRVPEAAAALSQGWVSPGAGSGSCRCLADVGRRPCRLPIAGCPGCACLRVCCWSSGAPSLAFAPGYLGVQGVQPLFPQSPVPAQPVIDLGERLGAEAVDAPLRFLANLDQSRLAQHPQVPRYPRAGNRQQRRQFTRGRRATGQGLQHGPPALICQRPQRSFHGTSVPR